MSAPSGCREAAILRGDQAIPRSCRSCGLGPCHWAECPSPRPSQAQRRPSENAADTAYDTLKAERDRLQAQVDDMTRRLDARRAQDEQTVFTGAIALLAAHRSGTGVDAVDLAVTTLMEARRQLAGGRR